MKHTVQSYMDMDVYILSCKTRSSFSMYDGGPYNV